MEMLHFKTQQDKNIYVCFSLTSLKLSNAERIISWPPLTRQTAAKSSKTKAFVLVIKYKI